MRHHAQDVALDIADAGNIVQRPVGVCFGCSRAIPVAIAENDLIVVLQAFQPFGIDEKVPFLVGYGDVQDSARRDVAGERGVCAFHADVLMLADEGEAGIHKQRSGQQIAFREDLEAVADAQNQSAGFGESYHFIHYGREACQRPAAQIVAIGETARQHHQIGVLQVAVFVPDQVAGVTPLTKGTLGVAVAVGAWESDHADSQVRPSPSFLWYR